MSAELSKRIEETINSKTSGLVKSAEILTGQEEAQKLSHAIEVKGSEEEISEIQEVATSVRIPRVIGLAKLTQDIRQSFEKETLSNTDPELVYALIGEKPKTLERFSEILSRIQVFKQILSGNEEVISQINAWEQTINEIVDQILSAEEKDRFQNSVLEKVSKLSTESTVDGKDSYQDRFKKLVQNPRALKHLNRYLKPEKGEKFSSDLIKEYFETANFINVLNLMKKLEAPIDQMSQRNERIVEPEINFLEAKKTIQAAIAEVAKIKASSLDPETKKAKLAEQDQKVKDILTVCGNKIVALFPHDESIDSIQTSTLKNVLKNEKAICAGKVESMSALLNFFGLEHNKILIPRHTFLDITLPSGDILISDGNLKASTEEEKNRFYMLEAEKIDPKILNEGIDKLSPEMRIRVIRRQRNDGKFDYYYAKKTPSYAAHLGGFETSNESPIPASVLSNASQEFKSNELRNYSINYHAEFFTERLSMDKAEESDFKLVLELIKQGRITPENILSIPSEDLVKILNYVKENDPQLLENLIRGSREFLEKVKKTDRDFYNSTGFKYKDKFVDEYSGFIYKDILINSFSSDNYAQDLIENFIKQENINYFQTGSLVNSLLKSNYDIQQIYKIINSIRKRDEKFWTEDYNSFRSIYFKLENYLKLSPNLETSIVDVNDFIVQRKIKEKAELDYSDKNALKVIVLNLFKQGEIENFLKSENLDLETKQLIEKLIIDNSDMYIMELENDREKREVEEINLLESVKKVSTDLNQINKINEKLLKKYKKEDLKLVPLIQEIKESDPKEFYSSVRTIFTLWDKFPDNRQQLFEDMIANREFLLERFKNSEDPFYVELYHTGYKNLMQKIATDLGSEAKERFLRETGYKPPESTN